MLKSVFSKYIIAFMLIVAISFVILTAIIGTMISNYSLESQLNSVNNTANATVAFIENKLSRSDTTDFSEFCGQNSDDLSGMLNSVASASSQEIIIFITNNSGKILLSYDTSSERKYDGLFIPEKIFDDINSGIEFSSFESIEGIFDTQKRVKVSSVYLEGNYVCGSVMVFIDSAWGDELSEVMTKTILIASLWVMLAALIAVYFISQRIIEPLKSMSRAAKSFAAGKFDVRVPVVGNDEVAELAIAFNNMAKSLESLEDMRNNFMSSVSHDMRTPMTTISGFIDCILSGAIPPSKHDHYLTVIRDEVQRLSRLVTALLDISRIQAGDRKFVMAPFDICEMGRQVLISCEQRIDKKSLDVEFNIDDDNMYAVGDRDAIYQIMYNICDNAIKFSKDSGLLRLTIEYVDKKVRVSVYNEGEGIPPEDQPYIFDRFYKGDESRGKDKTGAGLGMFIAKTIIKAHNEDISLRSVPGEFCEFIFTLPRASKNHRTNKE